MRFLMVILGLWMSVSFAGAQTLKPGDNLSISVLQDPKLDRQVTVDPSGQIAFPLAGHIRASGLTPQALENILKSKLASNYRDENLDVTVALLTAARPAKNNPNAGDITRRGYWAVCSKEPYPGPSARRNGRTDIYV